MHVSLASGGSLITAANTLTLLRVIATPVIVYLVLRSDDGSSLPALVIFLFAALTDFFDGLLARRTNKVTKIGKKADPLADRLLISATIIALAIKGLLPAAGVIMVAARDLIIIIGYRLLEVRGVELRVSATGKTYTALLMLAILLSMSGVEINGVRPGWWLFWAGVAGSMASGAIYVVSGLQNIRFGAKSKV